MRSDFSVFRWHQILLMLGCLAVLPATGQETPPFDATKTRDGKTPFVTWIDGVWVNHLMARSEINKASPLLAEAFLRDALRVRPAQSDTVLALARFYHENGITPLDEMMVRYGKRLDPTLTAWNLLAAEKKETTREKLWGEADDVRYQHAATLFAEGNFVEAEIALRALLAEFAGDRRLLVDLGLLYIKTSDWGMAAAALTLANESFPDNFDVANNLAVCFDQIGRPDLVPPVLEAQLASRPDDLYLIQNISRYAMAAGDTNKAMAFAEQWAAIDAGNPDARNAFARLLLRGGRTAEAMQQADASLLADPKRWDTLALRIEIHIANGALNEARDGLAELAAMISPEQYQALIAQVPFNRVIPDPAPGESP